MEFSKPVTEIIRQRFSCRRYLDTPIAAETRERLEAFLAANTAGPLGTTARFLLVARSITVTDPSLATCRTGSTLTWVPRPAGPVGSPGRGRRPPQFDT